jgi:choline dehydrogenase-like flavoprotein
MEVHFTRAPEMATTAHQVMDEMWKILASAGYQGEQRKLQDPRGDHSTGTCRMGTSEAESVTNRDLRVHGLENLYVCSNAVMPTVAAVNPTLTLAALSLRLGAHLASTKGGAA